MPLTKWPRGLRSLLNLSDFECNPQSEFTSLWSLMGTVGVRIKNALFTEGEPARAASRKPIKHWHTLSWVVSSLRPKKF